MQRDRRTQRAAETCQQMGLGCSSERINGDLCSWWLCKIRTDIRCAHIEGRTTEKMVALIFASMQININLKMKIASTREWSFDSIEGKSRRRSFFARDFPTVNWLYDYDLCSWLMPIMIYGEFLRARASNSRQLPPSWFCSLICVFVCGVVNRMQFIMSLTVAELSRHLRHELWTILCFQMREKVLQYL